MSPIATSPLPLLPPAANKPPQNLPKEPSSLTSLISNLSLQPHPEGGFYAETDRSPLRIPNPFLPPPAYAHNPSTGTAEDEPRKDEEKEINDDSTRSASTTIFYLLTSISSFGVFHRNKARTMHTLHQGRGRYIIIHPPSSTGNGDGAGGKAWVETFVVGGNVAAGEKLQWMVEGGVYKASYLLPPPSSSSSSSSQRSQPEQPVPTSQSGSEAEDVDKEEQMLLISETVVPGFEFRDHDFLTQEGFEGLVTDEETRRELGWLVRRDGGLRS